MSDIEKADGVIAPLDQFGTQAGTGPLLFINDPHHRFIRHSVPGYLENGIGRETVEKIAPTTTAAIVLETIYAPLSVIVIPDGLACHRVASYSIYELCFNLQQFEFVFAR
jgi:hypothetical protein